MKIKKLRLNIVILFIVAIYQIPVHAQSDNDFRYAPSNFGVPEFIGGYESLAVIPAEDIPCALDGHLRIYLKASAEQTDVQTFLNESNAAQIFSDLEQLEVSQSVVWDVLVASHATSESHILTSVENWADFQESDCQPLLRVKNEVNSAAKPIEIGVNGTEIILPPGSQGYTVFENLDAGTYTDDNAQSVYMDPPVPIGSNQTANSYLLNNVITNSGSYFLQTGLGFRTSATGTVVYTGTSYGLVPQVYGAPVVYNMFHTYWFTISYTNSQWWTCVDDLDAPPGYDYVCAVHASATGTTINNSTNSGVFFENFNTNAGWYSGFGQFGVYGAKIYRNGIGYNWVNQHVHTGHACSATYLPASAISGTLVGGGGALFNLNYLPIKC